jgi:hypothetical protein
MSEDYINGQIELPGPISGIGGPRGGRLDVNPLVLASLLYTTDTAAIKIVAKGTMCGIGGTSPVQTGGLVGVQVEVTPLGDVSHCNGRRIAGIYAVCHINSAALAGIYEVVTGVTAAGEFELDITSTGDAYEVGCICCRANNTSGVGYHPASSFIRIRDAGSVVMPNLFHFVAASGAHASGAMIEATAAAPAATFLVKCEVSGTPIYLLATETYPGN